MIRSISHSFALLTLLTTISTLKPKDVDPINLLAPFSHGDNPQDTWKDKLFFEVTNAWNKMTQRPDQKFHALSDIIEGATREKPIAIMRKDKNGKHTLEKIDDGIGLLYVSTMPQSYYPSWWSWSKSWLWKIEPTNQYKEIRKHANAMVQNSKNNANRIVSDQLLNVNYNTDYEKNRTNLKKTVSSDSKVSLKELPTTDTYSSSEKQHLEITDIAKKRGNGVIRVDNCKAGKGRSVTGAIVYEADVIERAEISIIDEQDTLIQTIPVGDFHKHFTVEQKYEMLDEHSKHKRKVANINDKQKPVILRLFINERLNKKQEISESTSTYIQNYVMKLNNQKRLGITWMVWRWLGY